MAQDPHTTDRVAHNLELMKQGDDAFNRRDRAAMDAAHHPEMVAHITGNAEPLHGREAHAEAMNAMFLAFPDVHVDNDPYPLQFGQGDWITVVTKATGTFSGEMALPNGTAIPGTGKSFDLTFATTARWFVDSFKTELIKDRVWQTRSQLELAILEYVDWFNNRRLHESLEDIPPVEFEQLHADTTSGFAGETSVTEISPSGSERLTTRRFATGRAENHLDERDPARTAPQLVVDDTPQLVSLTLGSDHHQPMETN